MMKGIKKGKYILSVILIFLLPAFYSFADEWILAAQKFTFTQYDAQTKTLTDIASLIPSLILEQIEPEATRLPSEDEIFYRKLEKLQTERMSLFQSLTAEIRSRDSLVFKYADEREYKEHLEEAEKKIAEARQKIDDNLLQTEDLKKQRESPESAENAGNTPKSFFPFMNIFQKNENKKEIPSSEEIVLYKKDNTQLFSVAQTVSDSGIHTREFEKEVLKSKINGLLTGRITTFGEYMCVTVELLTFPGCVSCGEVTDVGRISDCVQIAQNLCHLLASKIYTSLPVNIMFSVNPPEAAKTARITVDGYVYTSVPDKIILRNGLHSIVIESKGWNTQEVIWNFQESENFLIEANLTEKIEGQFNLALLTPFAGNFLINGKTSGLKKPGSVNTDVTVNGQPVIGNFLTEQRTVKKVNKEIKDEEGNLKIEEVEEEGNKIGSFFYIPEALAVSRQNLILDIKPVDNALEIDTRRKSMYRNYSYLICTLPLTFITSGVHEALTNSSSSTIDFFGKPVDRKKMVNGWNVARWCSAGISAVAGGFFIYELVRYLMAAEKVLPDEARYMTSEDEKLMEQKYEEFINNKKLQEEQKLLSEKQEVPVKTELNGNNVSENPEEIKAPETKPDENSEKTVENENKEAENIKNENNQSQNPQSEKTDNEISDKAGNNEIEKINAEPLKTE